MPLTRDQIITSCAERLGKRTDLVTSMETEIVYVQSMVLEGKEWLPWFLETEDDSLVCVVGDNEVALPSDFLIENDEMGGLEINIQTNNDEPWQELTKDDLMILRRRFPEPTSATPRGYSLRGNTIILTPTPDIAYPLRLNYFARDTELSTNVANQWTTEAADVLTAELLYFMAKDYIKDNEMAQGFATDAARAWRRLHSKHIARRENGGKRMVGDE